MLRTHTSLPLGRPFVGPDPLEERTVNTPLQTSGAVAFE